MEYTLEEKYKLIKEELLKTSDTNPIKIVKSIMMRSFINIHGPEHHFLDGASLMVAIHNAGMKFNLSEYLDRLAKETIKIPGAICAHWGICGSVTSIAAVFAIIDNTSPLSKDKPYSDHLNFTSNTLAIMSKIGGPRCCKRNAFISITEGSKYANEHYNLKLPIDTIKCEFSNKNEQCLKNNCPFHE